MKQIYIVYGPTASGKTKLAIKLAKKLDGEIINADSRQVYKYMDIGTAKGNVRAQDLVPQLGLTRLLVENEIRGWLFDVTTPDKPISLAEYQELAYAVIKDIIKREKTPILVGGTGLYIDAVTKGYSVPKVKPNKALRKKLEKLDTKELREELKKLNKKKFELMNNSDKNNPRRLIRAIEVAKNHKPKAISNKLTAHRSPLTTIFRKPNYTKDQLSKNIDKRVEQMFEDGLIEEVQKLLEMGYSRDLEVMKGMGYKEVIQYLDDEITLEETKKLIKTAHKQYAKRQETWFKKFIPHS